MSKVHIKLTSTFIAVILIGINSYAQKLKEDFQIRVLPDNFWHLEFYKNKTYKYTCFNGWAGETTLDSGTYSFKKKKITLLSEVKDTVDHFPHSRILYLNKIYINKHQGIAHMWVKEKFSLLKQKFLVLSEEPFDESWIYDKRDLDPNWK